MDVQTNNMDLNVHARPISPKGNLMGFAEVQINNCFVVRDIKIISGENGLYASMPSVPDGKGGRKDQCFPTTAEFRAQLNHAVVEAYGRAVERIQNISKANDERPSVQEQLKAAQASVAAKAASAEPKLPKLDAR